MRIAALAPQREDLGQITQWLQRQCEQADVDIRLETTATAESIRSLAPDSVVIATGATPGRLTARLADPVPIHDAWVVLKGEALVGKSVLVMDAAGNRVGFSVAQLLAEQGHHVILASSTIYPGSSIDTISWRVTYARLLELGVTFQPLTTLSAIKGGTATLRHV